MIKICVYYVRKRCLNTNMYIYNYMDESDAHSLKLSPVSICYGYVVSFRVHFSISQSQQFHVVICRRGKNRMCACIGVQCICLYMCIFAIHSSTSLHHKRNKTQRNTITDCGANHTPRIPSTQHKRFVHLRNIFGFVKRHFKFDSFTLCTTTQDR